MSASTPRLAASVILARPAASGVELYMTRRSRHSPFAADAYVFPGGTVDAQDSGDAARARTVGLESARLTREFRAATPAQLPNDAPPIDGASSAALFVAALRELFEEAGILIARTHDGAAVDAVQVHAREVRDARVAVGNGTLLFGDFLARHDWYADANALTVFSHWITPPSEPRRYDTHFFFALAPAGQTGLADARETHEGVWIAPRDALARRGDPHFHLVYPTIKHLERLAGFASVEQAREFARAKRVLTILPATTADGDGFVMPAELENAW